MRFDRPDHIMLELFGMPIGTPLQGGILATLLAMLGLALRAWIVNRPNQTRANNERMRDEANTEKEMRAEAAERFREFRREVHDLRNELHAVKFELEQSMAKSLRRNEKLNMVLFILRMVMDELRSKDPRNSTLAQARSLLDRVGDEPHAIDNSSALDAAEDTVDAANAAVREVKASEAKE